jgi:aminoglycoside phosphotransferase (APT) family kinase protein
MGDTIRYPVPTSFAQRGLEGLYPKSPITELTPISTGFANSIFSFKRDGNDFILRMPRRIDTALVREVEIMKALFSEGIPVPNVLEYDPTYQNPIGHPFMIMERLRGRNLVEVIDDLDDVKKKNLIIDIAKILHRIHRVHAPDLRVTEFSTLQSFIDEGLSSIRRFADSRHVKNFGDFEDWFQRNRPNEASYNKSFIHNDFHALNIMVNEGSLSGILDWNGAIIGEGQADVAFFSLLMGAIGYQELADKFTTEYRKVSGLRLGELNFYETAIAVLKLLQVPLQQKEMKETGQMEKADVLRNILNRVQKHFIKIIEENTDLSADNLI